MASRRTSVDQELWEEMHPNATNGNIGCLACGASPGYTHLRQAANHEWASPCSHLGMVSIMLVEFTAFVP